MICIPAVRQGQNVYDDPDFFAGYKSLRQHDSGLNEALEIPALRSLMPNLDGKRVLDLGCGFGDFARHARHSGASSVTAIDISEKMLKEAADLTDDSEIFYLQCAIEDFVPAANSFDVVVSSMALHYVCDLGATLRKVFNTVRPQGFFIFSIEHPVCTANPIGWMRNAEDEEMYWPLDRYQDEGVRETNWIIQKVLKYHRTTATYVPTLIESGFHLEALDEPKPLEDFVQRRLNLQQHNRRPPVLLFCCSRE
jgi:ubiquinone/menaquinone biosynthesis C-methylase UbiE